MPTIRTAIIYIILLLPNICSAQGKSTTDQKQCLAMLRKVYDSEKEYLDNTITSGKSWRIQYILNALVKQPGDESYTPSQTRGTMLISKDSRYFKEDEVEIYIDKEDVFTIDNEDAYISRTLSTVEAMTYRPNPLFNVNDTGILKQYTFESCKEIYDTASKARFVVFSIKPKNPNVSMITKIVIHYDKKAGMMKMSQIWYNELKSEEIKMMAMKIESRSRIDSVDFDVPIKKNFLTSGNQLKTRYKDYEYKDYSKKNPKNM